MKHKILTFLFLLLAGHVLAQPVTRVRLITLQDPPDTTAQYYIKGGGGKDTIKWVPLDSIVIIGSTSPYIPYWDGDSFEDSYMQNKAGGVEMDQTDKYFIVGDYSEIGSNPQWLVVDPNFGEIEMQSHGTAGELIEFRLDAAAAQESYWRVDDGSTDSRVYMGPDTAYFSYSKGVDEATIGLGSNGVHFHDLAAWGYSFPTSSPSTTLGDTTVIAWAGTGSNALPIFTDKGAGGGGDNIANADLTLTGSRTLDLDSFPLTFDLTNAPLDSFAMRMEAPDGSVSGFYVSDGAGPIFLVIDKIVGTDFTTIMNYDGVDQVTLGSFGDTLVLDGERLQFSITTIDTDNTVTQVLALDSNDELVLTDASGLGSTPAEGYALAETATADLQNVGTSWEALEAQTSATASADWSFSTGTDLYTYSGSTAKYLVSFSVCFTMSSAALLDVTLTVQENGSDGNAKAFITTSGADADITYCGSGFDVVTANNTDTFGLGALISSGTHNITFESSQLALTKLVGQ